MLFQKVYYSLFVILLFTSEVYSQTFPTISSKEWICNGFNFDVDVANDKNISFQTIITSLIWQKICYIKTIP